MASATTGDGNGGSSVLRYAAQLFGLLAGAAGVVYITGAIVLAGRLFFAQLPGASEARPRPTLGASGRPRQDGSFGEV